VDAVGKRIWKRDLVAETNNIYYYNDNWLPGCRHFVDSLLLERVCRSTSDSDTKVWLKA
jgi:hypothetical protein